MKEILVGTKFEKQMIVKVKMILLQDGVQVKLEFMQRLV